MRKISTVVGSLLLGLLAYAEPNPQYVPLNNLSQFGRYVEKNMTEIIISSTTLAQAAVPNSQYFLITQTIAINAYGEEVDQGQKPFATLKMSSGVLDCARDIYSKVKANEWGEQRQLTFTLAPTIDCKPTTPK